MRKVFIFFTFLSSFFLSGFFSVFAATTIGTDAPAFRADLKNTLELQTGIGTATFSRADGLNYRATFTDWEGIVRYSKINEARFEGARRVENLLQNSENLSGTGWGLLLGATRSGNEITMPAGGGEIYQTSVTVASGDIIRIRATVTNNSGSSEPLTYGIYDGGGSTLTTVNKTIPAGTTYILTDTATNVNPGTNAGIYFANYSAGAFTITITKTQLEIVNGQSNQNPSEYVSTGVKTAAPYHGANVDGVKYFSYQNGNTVASNIVTEAVGTAIPDATLHGFLGEATRINYALQSQNFDSPTWVKSNMTVAMEAVAAPNGSSTVQSITAGAANATILQTISGKNATSTSFYLKRKTGTGNIDMTMDNGTTWTTQPVTTNWARYSVTQAGATPVIGLRIVTSGDAVYVWGAQTENGSTTTAFIPTTTVSIQRVNDALTYSGVNYDATRGTAYAETMMPNFSSITTWPVSTGIVGIGNSARILYFVASQAINTVGFTDSINFPNVTANSFVTGAIRKMASRWGTGKAKVFSEGAAGTESNFTGKLTVGSIGINGYGTLSQLNGTVRNVKIWKKILTDSQLTLLTTSTSTATSRPVIKTSLIVKNNSKATKVNVTQNTKYPGGVVGLWSFNGTDISGTTVYDRSGNGYNGTTTASKTIGKSGQALLFNGTNQYVGIGACYNGVKSVAFWIKPKTTTQSILDLNGGTDKITVSGGTITVTGFGGASTIYVDGVVGSVIDTGWHHVVVTTASALNASSFYLGVVAGNYFAGVLDEVRLYNLTLSATDVKRLYLLGK